MDNIKITYGDRYGDRYRGGGQIYLKHDEYSYNKNISDYSVEDFYKHFKDNPDKFQEIITRLRKDKIERIRNVQKK